MMVDADAIRPDGVSRTVTCERPRQVLGWRHVRRGSPVQEKSDRAQEGSNTMRVITREEVVEIVTETARRAGLTFEEFMADGEAGLLTDAECREDWLTYRNFLRRQ